jgi:polyisoprenoid-binding protein YceI
VNPLNGWLPVFIASALFPSIAWTLETARIKGTVGFLAETNVKMFRFKGESSELAQSKLSLEGGNRIAALEVRVPVASLKTGMDIRDKHTVERVFTSADGSTPDIVFTAGAGSCVPGEKCEVSGTLSFRGVRRPLRLNLALDKDGARLRGDAVIDVLDFGVKPEALAWTQVHVENKVPVTFEAEIVR